MNALVIDKDWLWTIIYIVLITVIWPLAVLIVSIPFGQSRFFTKYIKKIGFRMGIGKDQSAVSRQQSAVTQIAIFASGAGSNAQKIIDHFKNSDSVRVSLIVCNNSVAGVLKIAERENIPAIQLEKEKFFRGNGYVDELKERQITFIVLAGFLWKIPLSLIKAYPGRIINIHPALLPKHGGKGMYGSNIHAAVLASGAGESGITIHYVDEHYDNGDIIFQAKCPVLPGDSPDSLAQRIHQLEYEHYSKVIEQVVQSNKRS